MAPVTIRNDFRAQENKICTVHTFSPSVSQEEVGLDVMI